MIVLRKAIIVLVLGLLALLIPGTILKGLMPTLIAPNFLLILLVYVAFYQRTLLGALLAFLLGLELDICSAKLLGPWAGSYAIVFGLLVVAAERVFIESTLAVMLAVFVSSLLSSLVYHVTLILVYGVHLVDFAVLTTALIEAALTTVLAPLVFFLLKKILRSKEREGSEMAQSMIG